MPEYLSPGVYVEEVDAGPKPIESVATSTAAFVGFTEKAELVREIGGEMVVEDLLNKPQLVTNWTQYKERFGGFVGGVYLPHAVYGFFNNGGARCYIISVKTIGKAEAGVVGSDGKVSMIAKAKEAGFGGLQLRVSVDAPALPKPAASKPAAKGKDGKPAPEPEASEGDAPVFTIKVERQLKSGEWQDMSDPSRPPIQAMLQEEEVDGKKQVKLSYVNNRAPDLVDILIPDAAAPLAKAWPKTQQQSLQFDAKQLAPPTSAELNGDVADRTGVQGLEALEDVTIVAVPDLMVTPPGKELDLDMVKGVQTALIAHCEKMGDRVAILDSPPDMMPQEINEWRMVTAGYDSSYAVLYYPWIKIDDPISGGPMAMPPSGHMAGIWSRNDNTRGVHKAPANEIVLGATGLAYNTTKGEQDVLNPNGVNCIRAFPGRGIRVWGARTLSSDPSWRYLNVRRLFNMVEKSIELGTQWVVFEPNDYSLWARVKRDVSAFLRTVWRDGALFGLSPAEAFYVKCDEELNPSEVRDLGRLYIEIGMCPVKPAEFVIFRISQWAGPNAG